MILTIWTAERNSWFISPGSSTAFKVDTFPRRHNKSSTHQEFKVLPFQFFNNLTMSDRSWWENLVATLCQLQNSPLVKGLSFLSTWSKLFSLALQQTNQKKISFHLTYSAATATSKTNLVELIVWMFLAQIPFLWKPDMAFQIQQWAIQMQPELIALAKADVLALELLQLWKSLVWWRKID